MPTGRQNTFAAHTLPEAVLAVIRTDRPLNLADAFEAPISGKNGKGLVAASAKEFVERAQEAYADFCALPAKSFVIGKHFAALGERLSLDDMLVRISQEARSAI